MSSQVSGREQRRVVSGGVLPTLVIGALGTLLATGWLLLSPVLTWRE